MDQLTVAVDEYLGRLDGLVYGENPRNGFFRGTQFLHPDMRFRIDFPQGWRTQNLAQAVMAGSPQQDAVIQLTLAQGTEAEAANRFFGQQGIASAGVARQTINGLPAVTGRFQAQTQDGVLAGFATFIRLENRTFQILGFTPAQQLNRYDGAFRAAAGSFAVLTDPQALAAQPDRIAIVRVTQSMTLTAFNERYPSRIPIEQLAIINQLAGPTATIPANYRMKRVVAGS
jgi:predicted Zn-dependent protease